MGIRSTRSQTQSLSGRSWEGNRDSERAESLPQVPWPVEGTAGVEHRGGWAPCPVLFAISTPRLLCVYLIWVEKGRESKVEGMRVGMWREVWG